MRMPDLTEVYENLQTVRELMSRVKYRDAYST